MAPRWPEMGPRGPFLGPDTDRGEKEERKGEHVWPTMAPGALRARGSILKQNTHTPIYTGSEHALGRRPGEFMGDWISVGLSVAGWVGILCDKFCVMWGGGVWVVL